MSVGFGTKQAICGGDNDIETSESHVVRRQAIKTQRASRSKNGMVQDRQKRVSEGFADLFHLSSETRTEHVQLNRFAAAANNPLPRRRH